MKHVVLEGGERLGRRAWILGVAASSVAVLASCKRELRCKQCGMRIDPASPWQAELMFADGSTTTFDTPRCAMQSWRAGAGKGARRVRVREYYEGTTLDGSEVRFVLGGDVVGPMGPDLVPVSPSRVSKFIQDHGADRALTVDEITPEVIASIGAAK